MSIEPKIAAIILAAGSGTRLAIENPQPKQFRLLDNKPVYRWSLDRLLQDIRITQIRLVVPENDVTSIQTRLQAELTLDHFKKIKTVAGGETRAQSSYNGMCALEDISPDYVLIHDAARPYIPEHIITELIKTREDADGVIPGVSVIDTIKQVDVGNFVTQTPDRTGLRRVQTPQLFDFKNLLAQMRTINLNDSGITDDASIIEKSGGRIKVIQGAETLMKITNPGDFEILQMLLG